ncbi:MAG: glycosyltransferase [Candidatus Calescibacterium sp.]|nr:glycosyltransferase [Candidatus Calescibacterium sp.]MDW8132468.1 glycosyltransferase [Candidatus Calescibacterium sp.]
MDLSVIVPYHNEGINVSLLYLKIIDTFERIQKEIGFRNFEILFIDDGSTDSGTKSLIQTIENTNVNSINVNIEVYRFNENQGQSAALSLGFSKFSGKYVSTIDADLQNDPEDLIPMLKLMLEKNPEVVSGYRNNRSEGLRVGISNIGNLLIRIVSGYSVRDVGCSLKLYKNYVIKDIKLPNGYHRFLPIISRSGKDLILNYPVKHFKRIYGKSHYNYSRIWWLLKNIFVLPFLKKFNPDRVKKSLKILNIINVLSFLPLLFAVFEPKLLTFLFFNLFLNFIYINLNNFWIFQKSFEYIKYERIYQKKINLIYV